MEKPVPEVIILRGLPASGKTTFAKGIISASLLVSPFVRVSRDDFRAMLSMGSPWSPALESVALFLRDQAIAFALSTGFSVIVDDTNLTQRHIDDISTVVYNVIPPSEVRVHQTVFETPIEMCVQRDALREHPVGEAVIRRLAETKEF